MTNTPQSVSKKAAIAAGIICACAMVGFAFTHEWRDEVVINEVSFSMNDGFDWIELYNPSNRNITLEGVYLSDDDTDLTQFKLNEQLIVPAGGYAVIYGERSEELEPSLNFNFSGGETLYLSIGDAPTILDLIMLPDDDVAGAASFGRYPDGSDSWLSLPETTRGEANKIGALDG